MLLKRKSSESIDLTGESAEPDPKKPRRISFEALGPQFNAALAIPFAPLTGPAPAQASAERIPVRPKLKIFEDLDLSDGEEFIVDTERYMASFLKRHRQSRRSQDLVDLSSIEIDLGEDEHKENDIKEKDLPEGEEATLSEDQRDEIAKICAALTDAGSSQVANVKETFFDLVDALDLAQFRLACGELFQAGMSASDPLLKFLKSIKPADLAPDKFKVFLEDIVLKQVVALEAYARRSLVQALSSLCELSPLLLLSSLSKTLFALPKLSKGQLEQFQGVVRVFTAKVAKDKASDLQLDLNDCFVSLLALPSPWSELHLEIVGTLLQVLGAGILPSTRDRLFQAFITQAEFDEMRSSAKFSLQLYQLVTKNEGSLKANPHLIRSLLRAAEKVTATAAQRTIDKLSSFLS